VTIDPGSDTIRWDPTLYERQFGADRGREPAAEPTLAGS
jgi:hypothetical protein